MPNAAILQINQDGIKRTLCYLKQAKDMECIVLWLGKKHGGVIRVQEVYLPHQMVAYDSFHIPENSMIELLSYLRQERLIVAAQVHTHPGRAYHSPADDAWAVIRHVGGLSLVLPVFAKTTSLENFVKNTAVFRLSEDNIWEHVPANRIKDHYEVVP